MPRPRPPSGSCSFPFSIEKLPSTEWKAIPTARMDQQPQPPRRMQRVEPGQTILKSKNYNQVEWCHLIVDEIPCWFPLEGSWHYVNLFSYPSKVMGCNEWPCQLWAHPDKLEDGKTIQFNMRNPVLDRFLRRLASRGPNGKELCQGVWWRFVEIKNCESCGAGFQGRSLSLKSLLTVG